MEKLSLRTLEVQEMEKIEGGCCSNTLAVIAVSAAVVSVFVPPVGLLGWTAVGAWMGKCL